MPNRLRERLARAGLIGAAALQLLGATLLASVHAEPVASDAVALAAPGGGGEDPQAPPAHDGQHCALCQAIGTSALPEERTAAPAFDAPHPPVAHGAPRAAPAHRVHRAPARAPPAAA